MAKPKHKSEPKPERRSEPKSEPKRLDRGTIAGLVLAAIVLVLVKVSAVMHEKQKHAAQPDAATTGQASDTVPSLPPRAQ